MQKVALITGASRGIGWATARRLVDKGYAVLLVARDGDGLARANERLLAECPSAKVDTYVADVGKTEDAQSMITACVDRFGGLDVLVNNAGLAPRDPIAQMSLERFDAVLAVNVRGVYVATQAAWPHLATRKGVVVNISSMSSVDPYIGMGTYGCTKAWLNLFTQVISQEGQEVGIRAFCVAPGTVETKLMRDLWPEFPAEKALTPDEVASVVSSVVEPDMARASGETIFVRSR